MRNAVNLERCFDKFSDTWSPKIVAELNGQHVKLAKLDGEKCPWHAHAQEDEMFLVVHGTLDIHLRKEVVTVRAGEFYVVPKQVEHRVVPREFTKVLLFEPASTAHTGNVKSEITVEKYDRIDP